ncbi:Thioesterase/thiol ester dehydrase-isomerase [Ceratobasidium sp. AG-I]|nr:Thioesterase/thiol ester dehydrase-isomerase [Ceratobasidium sp. AG-I]
MSACLRFTKQVWKSFVQNQGHDPHCFPSLQIEKAIPGRVDVSLKIASYNLNRNKTVHGGFISSLTDTVGSLAVGTKGQFMTGVSTDISTSFVKSAGGEGDTLFCTGTVVGMGRTLAYTKIDFKNAQGQLVAFGHHTKFIGKTVDHPSNVKFSPDGEEIIDK